jgi:excisionase family DNA binding protein
MQRATPATGPKKHLTIFGTITYSIPVLVRDLARSIANGRIDILGGGSAVAKRKKGAARGGVEEHMAAPMHERRPTIMTLEEVSRYLRINKSTVYRMARDGTLPAWKLGNVWRFKKDAIERWIADTQKAQQQRFKRKAP